MTNHIVLLYGDDSLALRRQVDDLTRSMGGDPTMAEMNTTVLDGKIATDEEINSAAYSMPFLAERRLVVVHNPLAKLGAESSRERFLRMLDGLPETTLLALVIEDTFIPYGARKGWEKLKPSHWLMKWMDKNKGRASVQACKLPDASEMPSWISREAERLGGRFIPSGAAELAVYVGSETQIATQEITKLLTYVDYQRPVEVEDVRLCCASAGGKVDLFGMVEATAEGEGRKALKLLHDLLEVEEPQMLFGMLVRQFRQLLPVRELLDEGASQSEIARATGIHEYVVGKLMTQARRYTLDQLRAVFGRLLEMDTQMKTSQVDPEAALDLFLVEMSRR